VNGHNGDQVGSETDPMTEDLLTPARQAAARLERNSTSSGSVLVLLGIVQAVLVMGTAPRFGDVVGIVLRTLVVLPLVFFVIHAAQRPVKPRHHGSIQGILGAAIAVVITLAGTLGRTLFPESIVWWVLISMASAVPYLCAAYLERRRRRRIMQAD
jgi:hypothetical protein